MSDVANKELSAELAKVSGWDGERHPSHAYEDDEGNFIPYFTVGYLLRKLPKRLGNYSLEMWTYPDGDGFCFGYYDVLAKLWLKKPAQRGAAIPEDALCKLAIELFKQGVLTKEVR